MKGPTFLFISILLFSTFAACKKDKSCEVCGTYKNKPPVAVAGADKIITLPTDSTRLNGAASYDPDGAITNFQWSKIEGPSSYNIISPNAAQSRVEALTEGVYLFELKITDNENASGKDTIQITVNRFTQGNRPPNADAGPDQAIFLPSTTAVLNGSNSSDPDNNIASYSWTKIEGPVSFNIVNGNSSQTQVINLVQGTYLFELKVTDGNGLSDLDTTLVSVILPVPPSTDCYIPESANFGSLSTGGIMATAICNNKILVAENNNTGTIVDFFDPITNTIISSANLSMSRYQMSGVGVGAGGKAFFAGGFRETLWSEPVSRVDIYDAATDSWRTAELSIPRGLMAVGVVGNKVFFAGGITTYPNVTSRVDIYDLTTGQWTTAELSEARGDFAAAVVGNKIIFTGGRTNTGNGSSKKADIYDAVTNTWSSVNLSKPLIGVTSVSLNNRAYFTGSDFGLAESFVHVYDLQTDSWSVLQLSEGKVWIPVGTSSNKIAFIGGMLGWFNHSKKIEIYDPATNSFSYRMMDHDFLFESLVSYNNFIYSFGGTINEGDTYVSSICRLKLQ